MGEKVWLSRSDKALAPLLSSLTPKLVSRKLYLLDRKGPMEAVSSPRSKRNR
jgi:hypothetical protein